MRHKSIVCVSANHPNNPISIDSLTLFRSKSVSMFASKVLRLYRESKAPDFIKDSNDFLFTTSAHLDKKFSSDVNNPWSVLSFWITLPMSYHIHLQEKNHNTTRSSIAAI